MRWQKFNNMAKNVTFYHLDIPQMSLLSVKEVPYYILRNNKQRLDFLLCAGDMVKRDIARLPAQFGSFVPPVFQGSLRVKLHKGY